jgi:hypothetical protein
MTDCSAAIYTCLYKDGAGYRVYPLKLTRAQANKLGLQIVETSEEFVTTRRTNSAKRKKLQKKK